MMEIMKMAFEFAIAGVMLAIMLVVCAITIVLVFVLLDQIIKISNHVRMNQRFRKAKKNLENKPMGLGDHI